MSDTFSKVEVIIFTAMLCGAADLLYRSRRRRYRGCRAAAGREGVGEGLRALPVVDAQKGVVGKGETDTGGGELAGQRKIAQRRGTIRRQPARCRIGISQEPVSLTAQDAEGLRYWWAGARTPGRGSQVRTGLFAGGSRIRTCMGLFLSSSHFWFVGSSLFGGVSR
jgi:hypothetical protein